MLTTVSINFRFENRQEPRDEVESLGREPNGVLMRIIKLYENNRSFKTNVNEVKFGSISVIFTLSSNVSDIYSKTQLILKNCSLGKFLHLYKIQSCVNFSRKLQKLHKITH